MARKSSDMVLLLGSRGQYRSRNNGFLGSLRGVVGSLFGSFGRRHGSRRMETRSSRTVSAWVAFGAALVCFVGGFVVGDHFAAAKQKESVAGLNAGGVSPGFIGEVDSKPLSGRAFIVSAYQNVPAGEAKARAKALSDWLRGQQLAKARPYEYASRNGPLWVVAVYFDGEAEMAATRDKLRLLPEDAPDAVFCQLRKGKAGWPEDYPIQ